MRCFIIGGGGSLKDFDFSRLKDEITIGINYVFKFFEPTYLIWCDEAVYNQNKEEIDRLKSIKYAPTWWIGNNWQNVKGFSIADSFQGKDGLIKGLYGGKNGWMSGVLAISLASALGYSPIYLLGFDGDKTHFHDYSIDTDLSLYNSWYEEFRDKWEIYNCSLKSSIGVFPKIDINKILGRKKIPKLQNRNFVVVAYYTPKYKKEAEQLLKTMKQFDLEYDVQKVKDLGNWNKNTHYKPTFIREMLEKHKKPILYVDADARFQKYPDLIDKIIGSYDIAVHYKDDKELLTGTIFFDYNEKVLELIKEWEELCQEEDLIEIFEQKLLQDLLEKSDLKKYILPAGYTLIFDLMAEQDEPIILQTQASRRLRWQ